MSVYRRRPAKRKCIGSGAQLFFYDEEGKLSREVDRHFQTAGNSAWGLTAWAAAALGIVLFVFGRKRKNGGEWVILFAAVVFAGVPLFLPYLFRGHDLEFHIARIMGIRNSMDNGVFPARLDGFSFNGYGYGELVFYPSLFLYLPAFFMYIGVPLVDSVNFWLFLCNAAAAGVMYYSASRLFRSSKAGCISAVLATAGCGAAGLVFIRRLAERRRLCAVLLAAAGTLLLNLWFIVPFLDYMGKGLNLSVLQFPAHQLAISPAKLLEIYPIAMGAMPVSDSSMRETMALTLGLSVMGAAGLFIWQQMTIGTEKKNGGTTAKILLAMGLILSLCATDLFPWRMLVKMEWFNTAASYLQFPWRLLGPALCVLSMAGAYAVCRQWPGKAGLRAAAGVLVFCILLSQHYLDEFGQSQDFLWSDREINSMLTQREYLYENTDVFLAEGSSLPAGPGITVTDSRKDGLSVAFSYETDEVGAEQYADLPLFYYPGYRAVDGDGNELPVDKSETGLVRVHFAAQKEGNIRVSFQERRLWRAAEAVSAVTAAALLCCGIFRQKQRRPAETVNVREDEKNS